MFRLGRIFVRPLILGAFNDVRIFTRTPFHLADLLAISSLSAEWFFSGSLFECCIHTSEELENSCRGSEIVVRNLWLAHGLRVSDGAIEDERHWPYVSAALVWKKVPVEH